jgi:hypothetical protein
LLAAVRAPTWSWRGRTRGLELFEGGAELDGGDEEGAGLEAAVELDGTGAVAVAEHAAVDPGAQPAHL